MRGITFLALTVPQRLHGGRREKSETRWYQDMTGTSAVHQVQNKGVGCGVNDGCLLI